MGWGGVGRARGVQSSGGNAPGAQLLAAACTPELPAQLPASCRVPPCLWADPAMCPAPDALRHVPCDVQVAAAEKLLKAAEIQAAMAQQQLSTAGRVREALIPPAEAHTRSRTAACLSRRRSRSRRHHPPAAFIPPPPSQDADRAESGKAAAIAAAGGAVGALPFALGAGQEGLPVLLSLVASVGACLLFGVTYRCVRIWMWRWRRGRGWGAVRKAEAAAALQRE
jgi:hypothetical protein